MCVSVHVLCVFVCICVDMCALVHVLACVHLCMCVCVSLLYYDGEISKAHTKTAGG
jgi:hypothetical protein